jgi:hypothetical protein
MKIPTYKVLFISIIVLNLALISIYSVRKYNFNASKLPTEVSITPGLIDTLKRNIYAELPVDSTDIVLFGDSIIDGFPLELLHDCKIKNRGIPGNDTKHLLSRVVQINKAKRVVLMAGINDISNYVPLDTLENNMKKLISIFKNRILVVSVLPTTGSHRNAMPKVLDYNNFLLSYCEKNNIPYLDLFLKFMRNGELRQEYTYDGVHLTIEGYKAWATELKQFL